MILSIGTNLLLSRLRPPPHLRRYHTALSLRAFGVTRFATAKVKDFGNFDFERFGIHGLSQLDRLRAVDKLLTTGMWIQMDGNVLMNGAGIASPADTLPGHITPTPGRGLWRLWDPGLQPAP